MNKKKRKNTRLKSIVLTSLLFLVSFSTTICVLSSPQINNDVISSIFNNTDFINSNNDAGLNVSIDKKVKIGSNLWSNSVTVYEHETISFKLIVTNTGNVSQNLTNVHVVDFLPAEMIYNNDANPIPDIILEDRIEWLDIGPIPQGQSKYIFFNTTAKSEGIVKNYANVCCCCGLPKDEDNVTITILPSNPGISIIKQVFNDGNWVNEVTGYIGDDIDFKIIVNNIGNINLTSVQIIDTLPEYLKYNFDATITPDSASDHEITWDIGLLEINESIEILFSSEGINVGEEDNNVVVTTCQGVGDSDDAQVIIAGIIVDKQIWNSNIGQWVDDIDGVVGETLRFRIKVSYIGNGTYVLYNIHIKDELPECLEYVNNANPEETYLSTDGKTIWWNLTTSINAGTYTSIEFDALIVDASGCNPCENLGFCTAKECSGKIFSDQDTVTINAECQLIADANGPYCGEIDELIYISGSATGGTPPYIYRWDLDNDGFFDDAYGKTCYCSWDEDGTFTIRLKVTDNIYNQDIDSTSVFISPPDNLAPDNPGKPQGETTGIVEFSYSYSTSAHDPDDDLVRYGWDWNNDDTVDDWTGYYSDDTTVSISKIWNVPGTYQIRVIAQDEHGKKSDYSSILTVTISENTVPDKPVLSGPNNGRVGFSYTYTATSYDDEGDQLMYLFDWGDGSTSGWKGPYDSGQAASESHSWDIKGTFTIKVKVKDESGAESVWSDPLQVSMPKVKTYEPYSILTFIQWLIEKIPAFSFLFYLIL